MLACVGSANVCLNLVTSPAMLESIRSRLLGPLWASSAFMLERSALLAPLFVRVRLIFLLPLKHEGLQGSAASLRLRERLPVWSAQFLAQ